MRGVWLRRLSAGFLVPSSTVTAGQVQPGVAPRVLFALRARARDRPIDPFFFLVCVHPAHTLLQGIHSTLTARFVNDGSCSHTRHAMKRTFGVPSKTNIELYIVALSERTPLLVMYLPLP